MIRRFTAFADGRMRSHLWPRNTHRARYHCRSSCLAVSYSRPYTEAPTSKDDVLSRYEACMEEVKEKIKQIGKKSNMVAGTLNCGVDIVRCS